MKVQFGKDNEDVYNSRFESMKTFVVERSDYTEKHLNDSMLLNSAFHLMNSLDVIWIVYVIGALSFVMILAVIAKKIYEKNRVKSDLNDMYQALL